MFLEISQNPQENTCARGSATGLQLQWKNPGTSVFCKFCEISINTFPIEHLWRAASVVWYFQSAARTWKRHTNLYDSLENASKGAFKTSSNIYDQKQSSGGVLLCWNWQFQFSFSGSTSCELRVKVWNSELLKQMRVKP